MYIYVLSKKWEVEMLFTMCCRGPKFFGDVEGNERWKIPWWISTAPITVLVDGTKVTNFYALKRTSQSKDAVNFGSEVRLQENWGKYKTSVR